GQSVVAEVLGPDEHGIGIDDVAQDGGAIPERPAGLQLERPVAPYPVQTILAERIGRAVRSLVQRALLARIELGPFERDSAARSGRAALARVDVAERVVGDQRPRVPL